jgi:hypothetical protein
MKRGFENERSSSHGFYEKLGRKLQIDQVMRVLEGKTVIRIASGSLSIKECNVVSNVSNEKNSWIYGKKRLCFKYKFLAF